MASTSVHCDDKMETNGDFPPLAAQADDMTRDAFESGLDQTDTSADAESSLTSSLDEESMNAVDLDASLDMVQMTERLAKYESNFLRASQQVKLMDQRLESLHVRYTRANDERRVSSRYFLRLKAAVYEGVRNAFYMYALNTAMDICDVRRIMYGEDLDIEDYIDVPEDFYH